MEKRQLHLLSALAECRQTTQIKPLSFLDYTCEWIRAVNRGGLYEVKDEVYLLFREIEAKMQSHLMVHLKTLPTQS